MHAETDPKNARLLRLADMNFDLFNPHLRTTRRK